VVESERDQHHGQSEKSAAMSLWGSETFAQIPMACGWLESVQSFMWQATTLSQSELP